MAIKRSGWRAALAMAAALAVGGMAQAQTPRTSAAAQLTQAGCTAAVAALSQGETPGQVSASLGIPLGKVLSCAALNQRLNPKLPAGTQLRLGQKP